MWAKVDKAVTDQAPWVSMYNPSWIDFVSSRVKGYEWSPQWFMIIQKASIK
jgi:peptide/nickel transport system substrate-binding protein